MKINIKDNEIMVKRYSFKPYEEQLNSGLYISHKSNSVSEFNVVGLVEHVGSDVNLIEGDLILYNVYKPNWITLGNYSRDILKTEHLLGKVILSEDEMKKYLSCEDED